MVNKTFWQTLRFKIVSGVFTALLAVSLAPVVLAHGTIDQQYWDDRDFGLCIADSPVFWGQSFTPTASNMVAMDFGLGQRPYDGSEGPLTTDLTLIIYEGYGFLGEEVENETFTGVTITNDLLSDGYEVVHLDFSSPLSIEPGQIYTARLTTSYAGSPCRLQWAAKKEGSYESGSVFPTSERDAFFATYTASSKSDALMVTGVEGQGVERAPGLEKPFNSRSRANDNAGKKR